MTTPRLPWQPPQSRSQELYCRYCLRGPGSSSSSESRCSPIRPGLGVRRSRLCGGSCHAGLISALRGQPHPGRQRPDSLALEAVRSQELVVGLRRLRNSFLLGSCFGSALALSTAARACAISFARSSARATWRTYSFSSGALAVNQSAGRRSVICRQIFRSRASSSAGGGGGRLPGARNERAQCVLSAGPGHSPPPLVVGLPASRR